MRETSMARNNTTNVGLQLGALRRYNSQQRCNAQRCSVASLQLVLLRRCGATAIARVVTKLRHLWRCNLRCYNTVTLWRCNSRYCDAATRVTAALFMAATLRYDTTALHLAVMRRCEWRCYCCFFFFNFLFLASSRVFNLSSYTCEKERNKEQKRTRKSFETYFGLSLPSSSTFVRS